MNKFAIVLLSIVAILALVFVASLIANYRFNQKANSEIKEMLSNVDIQKEIIQKSDLEGLPLSVQRWLEYAQVIGKERISIARSKQTAVMSPKEGGSWMPVEAEQYFTVDEPGFIWKAKVKAAPLIHLAGRDKYYQGKGHMLIKALSLIPVADARGPEIDQGSMVRYLAEIVWLPTAALSNYIQWEEIDANSAKATMSYKGVTASGVFTFNEKGEVVNFEAQRYGDFDGEYRLETWAIPMREYREFEGIRVPTKGEVTWKLKTGDFSWYHFEVTDLEYKASRGA